MFSKIVIPLDDRDESATILPPASALARSGGGDVILVTVLSEDDFDAEHVEVRAGDGATPQQTALITPAVNASAPVTPHSGRTSEDITQKVPVGGEQPESTAMSEAVTRLEAHAAELRRSGIGVTVKVTYGVPEEEILRVIRDEGADSLAIATHRQSAIARTLGGSVTDSLVQESPVPVLSMHVTEDGEAAPNSHLATVIVPVDGTEFGEIAVEPAIGLALRLDARLVFIQAVDTPSVATAGGVTPETMSTVNGRTVEALTEATDNYLAKLVKKAQDAGATAEAASHFGSPASATVSAANSHEDAIVVMTSHARSGIARTILGSNADEVVRNLSRPVVIIKAENES